MIVQTRRKDICHLEKMKNVDFVHLCKKILLTDGIIESPSVSLKVDGFGCRFGKDALGRFFLETSRSGPILESNTFVSFVKNKNGTQDQLERAQKYADLFELIRSTNIPKIIPRNSKVICEILYVPMAKDLGSSYQFVTVPYDKDKVGSLLTIVPIDVITTSGEDHPDRQPILDSLIDISNSEIKIIDPTLSCEDLDVLEIIKTIEYLPDEFIEKIQSRKAIDREDKICYNNLIQDNKNELAKRILNAPEICGKDILGKHIEGLVIRFADIILKVTTQEFKEGIKK